MNFRIRSGAIATLLVAVAGCLSAPAVHAQAPGDGPGGPVLVLVDPADKFGRYYAEILRAEGLNEFAVADVGSLSAQTLSTYRVVVLAETGLSDAQAASSTRWVGPAATSSRCAPMPSWPDCSGWARTAATSTTAICRWRRAAASPARRCSSTAGPTAGRSRGATTVATLYSDAATGTTNPAVTLRTRRRRPGRRVHVRPRALGRLHAPGQPGVGGQKRDLAWKRPDPLGRPLLRRRPARLGGHEQGRDPAGRRAAAPAGEPRDGDERGPHAAAALLVPPARREGRRGHDRRRPRQWRYRGAVQPVQGGEPARLLGRELGVHPGDVVRLSPTPRSRTPKASSRTGSRSGCISTPAARSSPAISLRGYLGRPAAGVRQRVPDASTRR